MRKLLISFFFIFLIAPHVQASGKNDYRIMVIVPEYHLLNRSNPDPRSNNGNATAVPDPAGETEIIKQLLDSGFKVVDQQQVSKIRYNDQVKAALNGDNELASRIGLEYGADIIIIGEAFSESAGRIIRGFESCSARVEARAIRTDTAEILAADGKFASGMDVAQFIAGKKALQIAGGKLGEYLLSRLDMVANKPATTNNKMQLIILTSNYKDLIGFKKVLKDNFTDINNLNQSSYMKGKALIDVEYSGDLQGISESIAVFDFEKFIVEINEITNHKIYLTLTGM